MNNFQLNDIFSLANYDVYQHLATQNGYMILEIEAKNAERQFQVIEVPEVKRTYAEKRAIAYPSIPEQLDMIYWDKVNGTNLWQEKIAQIKAKYPKE